MVSVGNDTRFRKKELRVMLFDEEHFILTVNAEKACMTISNYVRNLILHGSGERTYNFVREDAGKIIGELGDISTALMQISYQAAISCHVDENDFAILEDQFIRLLSSFDEFAYK